MCQVGKKISIKGVKMKKKILFASLLLAGLLSAIELKIGASPVPHAQILEIVKEDLNSG